jgi:hypothetical protein
MPYLLVISYEFKIREKKIINPKDNRHSDRKKVSALHQGDTIPELLLLPHPLSKTNEDV